MMHVLHNYCYVYEQIVVVVFVVQDAGSRGGCEAGCGDQGGTGQGESREPGANRV